MQNQSLRAAEFFIAILKCAGSVDNRGRAAFMGGEL